MSSAALQFWVVAVILTVLVLMMVLSPLLRRRKDGNAPRQEYDIKVYKDQLLEIDADLERGLLDESQAEAARTEIKRRMLAAADSGEAGDTTAATAPSSANRLVMAAVVLLLPLASVLFYLNLGSPGQPDQPLAGRDMRASAEQRQQDENIIESVNKLAEHLKSNPDDMRGWNLLARTYQAMGRLQESVTAFARVYEISMESPDMAAEYGEALTLAADSQVTEQALALFNKALAVDRADFKARYYLGLHQAQQGDFRAALQEWVDLAAMSPPDAPWLTTVDQQVGRAAAESGLDPASVTPSAEALELGRRIREAMARARTEQADAPAPTTEDIKAAAAMSVSERERLIRSMVEGLDARLQDNPEDKEGWLRLERAYRVLGETDKADRAAARAAALP